MSISAERQKANDCDQSGDHQSAIKWLTEAAKQGDAVALTIMGLRFLVGDRASFNPAQGVQLLQNASGLGQAAASQQLSVLAALGVHMPQDWQKSMAYLVCAAMQGSEDAQAQLQLLSSNKALASTPATTEAHWIELAKTADLGFWHQPASAELLSEDPRIGKISALVPPAICQWLISKSRGKLGPAMVYDSVQQKTIQHNTRSNSVAVFDILMTNVLFTLVQTKIAATMKVPFRQLEPVNILHYKGGEQIRNHYDFINPQAPNYQQQIARNGDRIVTFLVYLNDDYTGGETAFSKLEIKHRGQCGEALFFVNVTEQGEPNLRTEHAGLPPASGEKWIITQFIRNRSTH